MKTLDFNEMENVSGGNVSPGTQAWCDGIDLMMAAGDDWQSIDSASYVAYLYDTNCR